MTWMNSTGFMMGNNDGNMKSWLVQTFHITTNADSQFLYYVLAVVFILILNI